MKSKIIITIFIVALYSMIAWVGVTALEASKTVALGQLSTMQMQDSNSAYIQAQTLINVIGQSNPFYYGWLLIAFIVWMLWRKNIKALFAGAVVLMLMLPTQSFAYYDNRDLPEYIEIMPNQSAFLIPLTGATKEGQASFMSETFLNENKVAMKRITIPHTLLKTGLMEQDKYIPASRLLLVDRTPVTREWVSAGQRGTSNKDEGFRFESAESINMESGIVLSAFVKEEDAAKFVYWFGTKTATNTDNPSVKFASVMNGRSLAEVVDDNVRRKVQAILASAAAISAWVVMIFS